MDAETGPGAVASGGGDWKAVEGAAADKKKRARSPDDEAEQDRLVRTFNLSTVDFRLMRVAEGYASTFGRYGSRCGAHVALTAAVLYTDTDIIIIAYIMHSVYWCHGCSSADQYMTRALMILGLSWAVGVSSG